MVKKMKSSSSATGGGKSGGNDLAASVKASAQQIWLAGMGAFAKAQEEGTKVFAELVKEGKHLQAKTQGIAEDRIGEVTGRMTAMADSMQSKAGQNWDKLEGLFEQRTAKAMGKLGVPTAKDVAALTLRVAALEAAMARTGRSETAASRAGAQTRAMEKATRKRASKSASKSVGTSATTATKAASRSSATSAAKAASKAATKTATGQARKRSAKTTSDS